MNFLHARQVHQSCEFSQHSMLLHWEVFVLGEGLVSDDWQSHSPLVWASGNLSPVSVYVVQKISSIAPSPIPTPKVSRPPNHQSFSRICTPADSHHHKNKHYRVKVFQQLCWPMLPHCCIPSTCFRTYLSHLFKYLPTPPPHTHTPEGTYQTLHCTTFPQTLEQNST